MRPLRRTPSRLLLAAALLFACRPSPDATETPTKTAENGAQAPAVDPWAAPAEPALATIQAHLAFLADDAQEGRPPGTEADTYVRDDELFDGFTSIGVQRTDDDAVTWLNDVCTFPVRRFARFGSASR